METDDDASGRLVRRTSGQRTRQVIKIRKNTFPPNGHTNSESVKRGGICYARIKMYGADMCTQ